MSFGFQYQWSCTTQSSPEVDVIYALARSEFPAALEAKFNEFPAALIATHGKDLTVNASSPSSGTSTPKGAAPTPVSSALAPAPAAAAAPSSMKKVAVNTDKVVVEATFMASSADIFSLLTDEKRIPSWSRAAAQVSI